MKLVSITAFKLITIFCFTEAVRLNKLFQYLDGNKAEHGLEGFLHIGNSYSVFLRLPQAHVKELVYELYETKNTEDKDQSNPRLLAVSTVPIEYIKDQLLIYRLELYKSKFVDRNVVPGTQVKTLREWQLDKALENEEEIQFDQPIQILRTLV